MTRLGMHMNELTFRYTALPHLRDDGHVRTYDVCNFWVLYCLFLEKFILEMGCGLVNQSALAHARETNRQILNRSFEDAYAYPPGKA